MSDSTPETSKQAPADLAEFGHARRERKEGRWFVISLAVHLIAFAILWFTPVREMVLNKKEKEKPETRLTERQLKEIVERVRDSAEDRARMEVEQMLMTQEMMRQNLERSMQEYQEQAEQMSADAPETAMDAQEKVDEAQDKALEDAEWALEKLTDAMDAQSKEDKLNETEKKVAQADRQEARATQQDATKSQAEIQEAQRQISDSLAYLDDTYKDVKDAHQQAEEAQKKANDAQDEATQTLKDLGEAEQALRRAEDSKPKIESALEREQERADSATEKKQQYTESLAEMKERLPKEQQEATDAHKKVEETKQTLEQQQNDGTNNSEVTKTKHALHKDEQNAKKQDKEVENLENAIAREEKRLADAEKSEERYTKKAEEYTQKQADNEARIEALNKKIEELRAEAVADQKAAVDAQKKANEQQKSANGELEKAVAEQLAKKAAELPQESQDLMAQSTRPDLKNMDLAELYDTAVETEKKVAEMYRQQRAADAAKASNLPITETLDQTQAVVTTRPEVDAELLTGDVTSQGKAEAHRSEVAKVEREMQDMSDTAARLNALSQGAGSSSGSGMGMSVSLSAASQSSDGQGEGQSMSQGQGQGQGQGAGSAQSALSQLMNIAKQETPQKVMDLSEQMRAAMGAPAAGSSGMPTVSGNDMVAPVPRSMPARRIAAAPVGSRHNGWVYVDSWYIIGPYANPNRRHIDTRFPPESVIDLDAVYTDETGRELRWVFQQCSTARLRPRYDMPYAIFYGYTEIWCERDMDLNIAVGSDDYSQVWVNGLPVWASGKQHKSWRPDEGFRKVYFKQGINRILYRLENGQHSSGMSLMINLQAEATN